MKNYIDQKISEIPLLSNIGQSINYFLTNINSGINNYEILKKLPENLPQDIESVSLNNNTVLIGGYITQNLNRIVIPSGLFSFSLYGNVDDDTLTTNFNVKIYYRNIDGSEVFINEGNSQDINILYPKVGLYVINITNYNDIVINNTSELLIKIYGFSNVSNKTINLRLYHDGEYNSFISTPLITSHNETYNIQGGTINERYHLNYDQYNKATQLSSLNNTGLLSNSDFQTFNEKTKINFPLDQSIYKYLSGNNTFENLTKEKVGLSYVDNTSDLNKPLSIATIEQLLLKNDVIDNTTDLNVKSISTPTGNLQTQINSLNTLLTFNKNNKIIYVSKENGDDNNNGFDFHLSKKTLTAALNLSNVINTGVIILLSPSDYSTEGTITISAQNLTISTHNLERGGNVLFGSLIIDSIGSIRLNGITANNITMNNIGNLYLDYVKFNSFDKIKKTGSSITYTGYLEINNCVCNGGNFNINSIVSSINIMNSNIQCSSFNLYGNNNKVNISNNLIGGVNIDIGGAVNVLSINNSTIYSTSSLNNALQNLNGSDSIIYLTNTTFLNPDNSIGKINLNVGFYSIINCYYNNNSSISGSSANLEARKIRNKEILEVSKIEGLVGINGSNFSTKWGYLDNLTGNIQQQLNNKIDTIAYSSINGRTITPSNLGTLYGCTQDIQPQINYLKIKMCVCLKHNGTVYSILDTQNIIRNE
jgi:hypothetical protein